MKKTAHLFVFALAAIGVLHACGDRDSRRDRHDDERMERPMMHQDTALRDTVGMDTSVRDPRTEPRPR